MTDKTPLLACQHDHEEIWREHYEVYREKQILLVKIASQSKENQTAKNKKSASQKSENEKSDNKNLQVKSPHSWLVEQMAENTGLSWLESAWTQFKFMRNQEALTYLHPVLHEIKFETLSFEATRPILGLLHQHYKHTSNTPNLTKRDITTNQHRLKSGHLLIILIVGFIVECEHQGYSETMCSGYICSNMPKV